MSTDTHSEQRKKDHINLAFQSTNKDIDTRFTYEPVLSAHPSDPSILHTQLLGKTFKAPIWVSSMTGGTKLAGVINKNLARACGEYGLGMGLGSCRMLLDDDTHFQDFYVRKYMGDQPLYANLGIAQLEQLAEKNQLSKAKELVDKLDADGLVIHVNPLQEILQPEGDNIGQVPIDTIKRAIDTLQVPIIVKEVGQGMGPQSISALVQLPIQAIEFAANGGTNFSKLELLRSDNQRMETLGSLVNVGHSIEDMISFVNGITFVDNRKMECKEYIVSGGIRNYLDGYYYINKLMFPSIYGQAAPMLKHSMGAYEELQKHIELQIEGLKIATAYLGVKV